MKIKVFDIVSTSEDETLEFYGGSVVDAVNLEMMILCPLVKLKQQSHSVFLDLCPIYMET